MLLAACSAPTQASQTDCQVNGYWNTTGDAILHVDTTVGLTEMLKDEASLSGEWAGPIAPAELKHCSDTVAVITEHKDNGGQVAVVFTPLNPNDWSSVYMHTSSHVKRIVLVRRKQ